MPKRYKPSERTPDTLKKSYIVFPTDNKGWTIGTWIFDPHVEAEAVFECESYFGDIVYYLLSELDWWLDPMEVDE